MKNTEKNVPKLRRASNDKFADVLIRETILSQQYYLWMMWVPIGLFVCGSLWSICGLGAWKPPFVALVGLLAGFAAMMSFYGVGSMYGGDQMSKGINTRNKRLLLIGASVKQIGYHFGDMMRIIMADYILEKWAGRPSGIALVPYLLLFSVVVAPPWAFVSKKGAGWETTSTSLRKIYWSSAVYVLAALLCPLLADAGRFAVCVLAAEAAYFVCGFVAVRDEWVSATIQMLYGIKNLTTRADVRRAMCKFEKRPPDPADIVTPEEARPKPPAPWIAQADSNGRKAGDALQIPLPRKTTLELRWCPATTSAEWRTNNFNTGFFVVGSLNIEPGHSIPECPHAVKFKKGFWMGTIPVTARQWEAVMDGETLFDITKRLLEDKTPIRKFPRQKDSPVWESSAVASGVPPDLKVNPHCLIPVNSPDIPVHYITWHEACAFCRRLTELARTSGSLPAGYTFRLPTSAEWEYACRAGVYTTYNDGSNLLSDSPRHLGLDRIGWYDGNARVGYRDRFGNKAGFHPCGQLLPNRWGIKDMHGNITTWCLDASPIRHSVFVANSPCGARNEPYTTVRGGNWKRHPVDCRSAVVCDADKRLRTTAIGLRVVLAATHQ